MQRLASLYNLQDLAKTTLRLILESQYVRLRDDPQRRCLYVCSGSGMGLRASGDISDCCFYCMAEIWALSCQEKADYGVECFFRFKDDIVSVLPSRMQSRISFVKELRIDHISLC